MSLTIGEHAPEFRLPGPSGKEQSLRELLADAQYVIVAFYPKDNTPG